MHTHTHTHISVISYNPDVVLLCTSPILICRGAEPGSGEATFTPPWLKMCCSVTVWVYHIKSVQHTQVWVGASYACVCGMLALQCVWWLTGLSLSSWGLTYLLWSGFMQAVCSQDWNCFPLDPPANSCCHTASPATCSQIDSKTFL